MIYPKSKPLKDGNICYADKIYCNLVKYGNRRFVFNVYVEIVLFSFHILSLYCKSCINYQILVHIHDHKIE